MRTVTKSTRKLDAEPRWQALIALLAVGGLHLALPSTLSFGPKWLVPTLVIALLAPLIITRRRGLHDVTHFLGHVAVALVTADLAASLALLISRLPLHKESPAQLLVAAASLWTSNVLIFASWYWHLDAGGPHARDLRESHTDGAFLFPQMQLSPALRKEMGEENWRPGFVDYLFVAFTTSSSFAPADAPVLSRWAKLLTMIQAIISLTTIALLAARAVNIL